MMHRVLTELQLYGYRPGQDEPDPRPLPLAQTSAGAFADIFDALLATLSDTRLEPDLEDLLSGRLSISSTAALPASSAVSATMSKLSAAAKRNRTARRSGRLELERLIVESRRPIERCDSMELFRDHAADQFECCTGSSWRPRASSMVNLRALTATMIDSRDFRRQAPRRDRAVATRRTQDRLHRRPRLQRLPRDPKPCRSAYRLSWLGNLGRSCSTRRGSSACPSGNLTRRRCMRRRFGIRPLRESNLRDCGTQQQRSRASMVHGKARLRPPQVPYTSHLKSNFISAKKVRCSKGW